MPEECLGFPSTLVCCCELKRGSRKHYSIIPPLCLSQFSFNQSYHPFCCRKCFSGLHIAWRWASSSSMFLSSPFFFFFPLFPIIIFQNLMSDTNTGYHRMRGGRGGNLRALDHFWREEGRDGVGRQRERERERGNETIPYHLGVCSIISIGWFKKGHGSGSKV